MTKFATFSALLALIPFAAAQSAEWGQCISIPLLQFFLSIADLIHIGGGQGWTGPTVGIPAFYVLSLLITEWADLRVRHDLCVRQLLLFSMPAS